MHTNLKRIRSQNKMPQKLIVHYEDNDTVTINLGDGNVVHCLSIDDALAELAEQYNGWFKLTTKEKKEEQMKEVFAINMTGRAKANGWMEQDDLGDPVARLDDLTVAKGKRGVGVGRRIVEEFEQWSIDQYAKYMVIEAKRNSIPFWEKMGFDVDDQGSEISTGTKKCPII
jgi:GNAT superfamily N-acetyltransferase